MSMSEKGRACEKYGGGNCERHRFYRHLCAFLVTLILLVLLTVLIIFLVLRPTKPKFYLRDVSLFNLSSTAGTGTAGSTYALTTLLQVTLQSTNPNARIGIYYDRLDAYAVYKGQQVTLPTSLPGGYQGHKDVTLWSPNLYGTGVPVPPYLAYELGQDEGAGFLLVNIRVGGRVRWKVGTWISGRYHLYVNCPAFFTVNAGGGGGSIKNRAQAVVDGGLTESSSGKWENDNNSNDWGYHLQQQMASCSVDV